MKTAMRDASPFFYALRLVRPGSAQRGVVVSITLKRARFCARITD
jgi:hypothetical protein